MKDNIRWGTSLLLSIVIVWALSNMQQNLSQFANAIFTYGILGITIYLLSEIIYSESFKLQEKVLAWSRVYKDRSK